MLLFNKNGNDLITYMMELSEANRRNPRDALVIRYDELYKKEPFNKEKFPFSMTSSWVSIGPASTLSNQNSTDPLEHQRKFNVVSKFSFNGNYVVAGGYVLDLLTGGNQYRSNDYDFFPIYDVDAGWKRHDATLKAYNEFLVEASRLDGKSDSVVRGPYCTTIRSSGRDPIQIIHKGSPSPVAVVAEFDQMCCRAFYDGESIYLTLEAAICWYYQINPIDWRFEGPSHIERAIKYKERGWTIIFPGLPKSIVLLNKGMTSFSIAERELIVKCAMPLIFDFAKEVYDRWGVSEYEVFLEDNSSGRESESSMVLKAIRLNKPIPYLITTTVTEMLENVKMADIPSVIRKVMIGQDNQAISIIGGDMYSAEIIDIQGRLMQVFLALNTKSYPSEKLVEFTSNWEMLIARRTEIEEILIAKYDHLLTTQRKLMEGVSFHISNPEKLFTDSFFPVIRDGPKAFYGDLYDSNYKYQNLYQIKKLFLLQWRFGNSDVWRSIPKDIMKLLFRYFYDAYFKHPLRPIQSEAS